MKFYLKCFCLILYCTYLIYFYLFCLRWRRRKCTRTLWSHRRCCRPSNGGESSSTPTASPPTRSSSTTSASLSTCGPTRRRRFSGRQRRQLKIVFTWDLKVIKKQAGKVRLQKNEKFVRILLYEYPRFCGWFLPGRVVESFKHLQYHSSPTLPST